MDTTPTPASWPSATANGNALLRSEDAAPGSPAEAPPAALLAGVEYLHGPERRKEIQMAYIRVCRDSGFRFSMTDAAHFVAKVDGCTAMDVWIALGMDNMERIANGTHPVLQNPDYDNRRSAREARARAALAESKGP